MRDLLIVGLAALYIGLAVGYGWRELSSPYVAWQVRKQRERDEAFARDVERRLMGKEAPRHRARAEPAKVRAARMVGSKTWSR